MEHEHEYDSLGACKICRKLFVRKSLSVKKDTPIQDIYNLYIDYHLKKLNITKNGNKNF